MNGPRLGFLGVGWIGQCRLSAIAEAGAAEIAAIADPVEEHVARCAEIAPNAARLRTLDELLEEELDGIVIATPSALHADQAMAALECGLAVFCQKPLGRRAEEVARIIATAKQADRLLGVDLSYRHTEGLRKIRELVRGGELGEVFAAEFVFHNAYGPQSPWFYDPQLSGGGCVIDLGIHLIDAALWILDASMAGVSGRVFAGGEPLTPEGDVVEDYAVARLDFDTGAVGHLSCSWRLHAGQDAIIRAEFFGTKGGAAMRNVGGSFVDFRAERFRGTSREVLAEPPDAWGGRAAVAWARQLAGSSAFDPEIERQIDVAAALDAIYGRAEVEAASAP
jgi:predicted dehydrogenase